VAAIIMLKNGVPVPTTTKQNVDKENILLNKEKIHAITITPIQDLCISPAHSFKIRYSFKYSKCHYVVMKRVMGQWSDPKSWSLMTLSQTWLSTSLLETTK
jgi:hypothetical protein